MYAKIIVIFLVDFAICSNSSDFLFVRTKRTDIDLSTCIDNFDIHKDKIIRTQDSQKMGAKYLNAIDLGSREECLRLCCETENCDVFVYEDKSSGSCYLFHCGPPEDFKCKFTHHVNYSSAVLAINRHIPDLESQIKLTKHEQDLTKLRKSDADPEPIPENPLPLPVSSTTAKTKEIPADPSGKLEEKKCSRYQFECRSTRECIAIYNACDGIPQCADGSDEAPELGCPETSTSPPPPAPPKSPAAAAAATATANNPPAAAAPAYDKNVAVPRNQDQPPIETYRPPPPIRQDAILSQLTPSNQDFVRPAPQDMRIPQRASPYSSPEYNPQMPQMGWNAHQSGPMSPYQMPPVYQGKTSHIFNHKENGLQVPEAEISQYGDAGNFAKVQNYYGDNYRQAMETPNWVNAHQDDLRYPARYSQESYYNNNINNNNNNNNRGGVSTQLTQQEKYVPPSPVKNPNWTNEKVENPEHIQIKMARELKQSKETHTETPHKEIAKIKIVEKTSGGDDYPDVVAYKMDGNDGVAQTPGGAVLSLTLGLIITFIMAIMIACRLRVVKRRIRKGGKGYAHDADYLVNGMYL